MPQRILPESAFKDAYPHDPNIDDFKAKAPLGFAVPSLWTLEIKKPANAIVGDRQFDGFEKDLMFLCNRAVLSGRHFATNEINTYGPIRKMPYQSIYDELQVSMYCRVNLTERKFFDAWQNLIHSKSKNEWRFYDEYTHPIEITCYSPQSTESARQYNKKASKSWAQGGQVEGPYRGRGTLSPDQQAHIDAFAKGISDDFMEAVKTGLYATHKIKLYNAYPMNIQPIALDWGTQNEIMRLDVTFTYRQWVAQNVTGYRNILDSAKDEETEQGPSLADFLSWTADTLEKVDLYTDSLPEWMKTASRNFRPEAVSGNEIAIRNKFASLF